MPFTPRTTGPDVHLYRIPDDATGVDDWVWVSLRKNVTINRGSVKTDVTAEDSAGWQDEQIVLKTFSVDIEAFGKRPLKDDPHFAELLAAHEAGTPVEFALVFGDPTVTGTKYRKFAINIETITEPYDDRGATVFKFSGGKAPGITPTTETIA